MIISDPQKLIERFPEAERLSAQISKTSKVYPLKLTEYYGELINWEDENCPIRLQCIPNIRELDNTELGEDPLAENEYKVGECIVHRYTDRVLFLVTNECFSNCRHCTRKRMIDRSQYFTKEDWKKGIEYIKSNNQIRDVLISGGDPFVLSNSEIEWLLTQLSDIVHVEIIRIGTRAVVTNPDRITDSLVAILRQHSPIWVNTHFNHSKELTAKSISAINRLVDSGIPVGNQTVLLKGVNDNAETLLDLFKKLVKYRVRPYYLYHCDAVKGVGHFRVKLKDGMMLYNSLLNRTTGFAIPKYVIDLPNGGGKVPVTLDYIDFMENGKIKIKNFENKEFVYVDDCEDNI